MSHLNHLSPIEREFADLCMFFSDGYKTCKLRFFLASLETRAESGTATDIDLRVLTMVKQFMNLTRLIEEGKLK